MPNKKKTWAEKYLNRIEPEIKRTPKAFADIPENGLMLIATPQIIEDYLLKLPKGTSVSMKQMRKDLAVQFGAEFTCPVTTGIFLRIVAEVAYEKFQSGVSLSNLPPFWRAIEMKSPLLKKLSFGSDFVLENRRKENIEA